MKQKLKLAIAGVAALMMTSTALAETQGVSDTEVTFGSVSDLSGIFAAVGVPAVNGANLRFDEANAAGGVHGRMVKFIVEDNGYQLPRAMQGYNKLLNRDKVFAMLLSLGTPMNIAGFRLLDPKGIPNISPLSASLKMLGEPMHNKFSGFSSYFDQAAAGITFLADKYDAKNICAMYLPSEYGNEVVDGAKSAIEKLSLNFAAETTHKGDEADFVGSLSKLKAAECEVVIMALGVRQSITVVGTAKKMGLTDMQFLNTSAGFLGVVAAVPGGVTEGLYASSGWVDLAARASDAAPAKFIADYTAQYGSAPGGFAMLGYSAANQTIMALEAAGKDLTTDSFIAGMETVDYMDDLMSAQITYGTGDHQGADDVVLSVVKDGGWVVVND
ncbi:MAG: branched-chain amino acid ABC transporter substrate-binding protein [Hyphomicrobiales bacterium]|nr:MAG: branched-chain amino acid ABC transporter substrate-binding protein [Hyphomicrobiales bacterium]